MLFGIDNTSDGRDVRERFDMSHFMEFTDGWYDSLNSDLVDWIISSKPDGWYTVREKSGRPDLVSYNIYGETQYWWILLLYNEILCASDLKTGMRIKYISQDKLLEKYMELHLPVTE